MSAKKIQTTHSHSHQTQPHTRLSLSSDAVRVRKTGIEFRIANAVPIWSEMSIDLQYPDSKKVHCTGVVVSCDGNRHAGYVVSFLFTKLSRQSQALVSSLAYS